MGKKSKEKGDRSCETCREWINDEPQEYLCRLAKVVVERDKPRVDCDYWQAG